MHTFVSNLSTLQSEGGKFTPKKKEVCRVKLVVSQFDDGGQDTGKLK